MDTTKNKGFTLIELVITLAIVAILSGIVAPSFITFAQDNRLAAQLNTIVASLHMARAEATTRRSIVTMCGSTDGATCDTQNWESGWIIFTDNNNSGDAAINGGDQLIRYQEPLEGGNTLRESGFNFTSNGVISFRSNGFMLGNAPAAGTLTLCDDRGVSEASAVIINISGTSRLAVDENSNGTLDNHAGSGNNITCP